MTYLRNNFQGNNFRVGFRYAGSNEGITLIELMIAMAIAGIVLMVIYSAYYAQTTLHRTQSAEVAEHQNLRGAAYLLESEIMMAGYDINKSDSVNFGITDITFRDIAGALDLNGNSSITFTADLNNNGVLDANETFSYSIYDNPVGAPDGILDLGRNNGAGRQIVGESIEALGLAYAYDNDGDVNRMLDTAGGNVIWAIDSDNDNALDLNLDTNNDGDIDMNDGPAGPSFITGTALVTNVPVGSIRAVKVWILARTKTPMLKYTDNNTYVVGNRIIIPNDNFRRELLVTTIICRNLGMQ